MSEGMSRNLELLNKLNAMKENTANGLRSAAVDCMEKFQPVVENKIDGIDNQLHRRSGFLAFVFGLFGKEEVAEKVNSVAEFKSDLTDDVVENKASILDRVNDSKVSSLANLDRTRLEHSQKSNNRAM